MKIPLISRTFPADIFHNNLRTRRFSMEKASKAMQIARLKTLLTDEYIPFLGGRPSRTHPLTEEELADLKIDLWTSSSVDKFLARLR